MGLCECACVCVLVCLADQQLFFQTWQRFFWVVCPWVQISGLTLLADDDDACVVVCVRACVVCINSSVFQMKKITSRCYNFPCTCMTAVYVFVHVYAWICSCDTYVRHMPVKPAETTCQGAVHWDVHFLRRVFERSPRALLALSESAFVLSISFYHFIQCIHVWSPEALKAAAEVARFHFPACGHALAAVQCALPWLVSPTPAAQPQITWQYDWVENVCYQSKNIPRRQSQHTSAMEWLVGMVIASTMSPAHKIILL